MASPINRLTLRGFKSIRSLEAFELGPINVLIGANGSGKSNFVSFFSLLREIVEQRLALAVSLAGGADVHLFGGAKVTDKIEADLAFGHNGYEFSLTPTNDNRLIFSDERIKFDGDHHHPAVNRSIGRGHAESILQEQLVAGNRNRNICKTIHDSVSRWTVYHFHDTSETAALRRIGSVRDNDRLRPDGGNLAAFLYRLLEEDGPTYSLIRDTIRLVAPFFKDFRLRPKDTRVDQVIQLEWEQKKSDYPFHPSQLSDGTLRFIALATALLQPSPPATIVIDEPELGLHPYALDILADLILQAEERAQLIISTQSSLLLNAFDASQVIVVDRQEGQSTFRRLDEEELSEWLSEEYTLSDLWRKNVYGGGPTHE